MRHWTVVLMGWLCVTAPFGVLTVSGQEPQPAAGAAPAPRAGSELARLERRVAELEAENADLELRLSRYKLGLEEAVAELNRVHGGRRRVLSPTREIEPPRLRPALETGNRLLSRPRTTVSGRRAVVSGEVRNNRPEHVRGTLVIELLRDGVLVDEARIPLELAPYALAPYSRVFELEGWAAGHYSARAGLAY